MPDRSRFPNIEAMAARALRDAGVCGGRASSSIPRTPTFPLAVVRRLGGIPSVERRLDSARIQVDVYGENKTQAWAEADAARLALHRMEGTTFAVEAGFVTGVQDELGLTFLPDPETTRDRYTFGVIIHAHTTFVT